MREALLRKIGQVSAVATIIAAPVSAAACTCPEYVPGSPGSSPLSEHEIKTQRFERAKDIVRGKFSFLSLGSDVRQGFTVRMQVEKAIKGDLSGEIELVTGVGNGDCGLIAMVINRMYYGLPADIEIRTSPYYRPGSPEIDICGYIAEPEPLMPSPSKGSAAGENKRGNQ